MIALSQHNFTTRHESSTEGSPDETGLFTKLTMSLWQKKMPGKLPAQESLAIYMFAKLNITL
jgi:hypothetical protein